MPIMDGVEFLRLLRSRDSAETKGLPVYVLTAATLPPERDAALRSLAATVIRKPFKIELILDLARQHCT
jgi:CheY-like chemotaxis protein